MGIWCHQTGQAGEDGQFCGGDGTGQCGDSNRGELIAIMDDPYHALYVELGGSGPCSAFTKWVLHGISRRHSIYCIQT